MTPRVHVYAVCWNEEQFLPYFLRHYSTFASHITIFDNESDDRSAEIALSFPNTSVVKYFTNGQIRDDVYIQLKDRALQESRGKADWVIAADADELVWHHDPLSYLAKCTENGVAILGTHGFNMISNSFPTTGGQVYEEVTTGAPSAAYSKPIVFAPSRVTSMNFRPGGHMVDPIANGIFLNAESELKLLHFALLGLDYVLPRCEVKARRLSTINLQNGWGKHYQFGNQRLTSMFNQILAVAAPLPFLQKSPPLPSIPTSQTKND